MTLKDLTPAARAAVEQKTIGGGWDGRSLVKLMAELDRWDNMAEGRKALAKKVFIGGLIGTIVGFVFMFFVSAVTEEFLYGLPVFLVPLAVLIMGIRMKKAARAVDLPNELRVSLRPVLRQLSQDLHPDEKIKVSMNLAGIDEKKCARKKDLPPYGRNRSLTQSFYDEDLCAIRLPLTDGSTAVLHMENQYLKLERSYSGRSGKSKSKTKWKKLSTVTAILIPPAPIQWNPSGAAASHNAANERMSFQEKDGVTVARMDRYYKFKAAKIPENAVPGADIVRMFVRLTAMRPRAAGGSL